MCKFVIISQRIRTKKKRKWWKKEERRLNEVIMECVIVRQEAPKVVQG